MHYQTNIANFDLDVETIADSFSKAIVKHEFPHTNGALLEDMGQKGRSITIRCYFGTMGGLASYEDYFEFIKILDDIDVIEFVHPEDGTLKGKIEKVDKRKNDREEFAEVDITFAEGRIEATTGTEISMPGAVENAFTNGQEEQQNELIDDMTEELGTDGTSAAAQVLDPDLVMLAQMTDLSAKARAYVAQVETAVGTLGAVLVEITQPANTLLATISYGVNLPGRTIGAIAECVERYAESYDALRSFPAQFQRSLKFSLDQLEASFRKFQSKAPAGSSRATAETAAMTMVADHIRLASSHRLALEAAYGFATDQTNRSTAKANEGQKSFDMQGNYFNPVTPDPIMTMTEIESTLATVMTAAQGVVDIMRGVQEIKNACAALVDFARLIKLDAERIKTVDIDGELPLHLILLQNGLPYNAAERVLAINPQIKHPNFVSGTIKIYAA